MDGFFFIVLSFFFVLSNSNGIQKSLRLDNENSLMLFLLLSLSLRNKIIPQKIQHKKYFYIFPLLNKFLQI